MEEWDPAGELCAMKPDQPCHNHIQTQHMNWQKADAAVYKVIMGKTVIYLSAKSVHLPSN